ncbi:MAG TPA: hypothetical protein VF711_02280 [Acidimicrobiales bacterium]
MILLIVVLIVAIVGGVIAFVIFQFSGVGTALPSGAPRLDPGTNRPRVRGSLVERLEEAPQGCLWSAIAAMAVWIALWAMVLILGLRVLLA